MSNQGLEEIARGEQLMELVAEIKPLHNAVLAQYPSLSAAREAGSDAYASYWSAFSAYQNHRFKLIKAKKREETQAAVSDHIDSVLAMGQSDSPDWDALLATLDPDSSAASSSAGPSALAGDSSATLAQRRIYTSARPVSRRRRSTYRCTFKEFSGTSCATLSARQKR